MKLARLSAFSAYARCEAHLTKQTTHGAIVTVLGVLLAVSLLIYELSHFWSLHRDTKLAVDIERRHELMITMDIVLPSMPCAVLSVDVLDASGTAESDTSFAQHLDLHKMRVDVNGKRMGKSEYMTPQSQHNLGNSGDMLMSINIPQALKHLTEMEDEMKHGEGCRLYGHITVKRVAGRIHLSAHQNIVFQLLPQLIDGHHLPHVQNISHVFNKLSFGPSFPGQAAPLDGVDRIQTSTFHSFKYYIKVVATIFKSRTGSKTETHQYSVTEYAPEMESASMGPPAIDLFYDLSPIVVHINDTPPSLLHLLVRLCAVVGGAFAITRMADRMVHWGATRFIPMTPIKMPEVERKAPFSSPTRYSASEVDRKTPLISSPTRYSNIELDRKGPLMSPTRYSNT